MFDLSSAENYMLSNHTHTQKEVAQKLKETDILLTKIIFIKAAIKRKLSTTEFRGEQISGGYR